MILGGDEVSRPLHDVGNNELEEEIIIGGQTTFRIVDANVGNVVVGSRTQEKQMRIWNTVDPFQDNHDLVLGGDEVSSFQHRSLDNVRSSQDQQRVGDQRTFKHQFHRIVDENSGNVVIESRLEEKQISICNTADSFQNSQDMVNDIDELFSEVSKKLKFQYTNFKFIFKFFFSTHLYL